MNLMTNSNIIAFANFKGGVGKSSLSANVAYVISEMKKASGEKYKVLYLDYDPQSNATSLFALGMDEKLATMDGSAASIADNPFLSYINAMVADEVSSSLFISPVIKDKFHSAARVAASLLNPQYLLSHALKNSSEHFDVVIIDCPPSPEAIHGHNALACAHQIVAPLIGDSFSVSGVFDMVKYVSLLNIQKPAIRVIQNRYDVRNKKINAQIPEWISSLENRVRAYKEDMKGSRGSNDFDFSVESVVIPHRAVVSEAYSNFYPLSLFDPACDVNNAIESLANTLIKKN